MCVCGGVVSLLFVNMCMRERCMCVYVYIYIWVRDVRVCVHYPLGK